MVASIFATQQPGFNTPLGLFSSGEKGGMWLPENSNVGVGVGVSLVTDASPNAKNVTQATEAARPILRSGSSPQPLYWEFDDINDVLSSAAIDFTGTNQITIFASLRKTGTGAASVVASVGGNTSLAGFLQLFAPRYTSNLQDYGARGFTAANAAQDISSGVFAAPDEAVLTLIFDETAAPGSQMILRRNGVQIAAGGTAIIVGANQPVHIGMRGTDLPAGMDLRGLIIVGSRPSLAQIEATERWFSARTAALATELVAPDDAVFGVTDFAGTVTQDNSKIRLTRSIVDGNGFQHCAPDARVRCEVTLVTRSEVKIDVAYTGLVTRTDTYAPVGAVLVNGAATNFTLATAHGPSDPHPTGNVTADLVLDAGTYTIEVAFPYCASVDFKGIRVPGSATIAQAPARSVDRSVFFGDSIVQGFNATAIQTRWAWLLALAKDWQVLDLGYGGRTITASDFTVAGQLGADRAITNIGLNNCLAGTSTGAIQAAAEASILAYRAAVTSAGNPTSKLYWINLFDCTNPGIVTSVASARTAISAAFTAVGGANDILIPGGTANGLPAAASFADLTHPDDAECITIASVLGGLIT